MSTSANLPAGFSITSINGVRCTAVPRSANTASSAVSISTSTSSSSTPTSTSTSTTSTAANSTQTSQPVLTSARVIPAAPSTPSAIAVGGPVVQSSSATTSAVQSTTNTPTTPGTPPPPLIPPPPGPAPVTSSNSQTQTTSTNISTTTSASPASKGTTPTESSSTSIAISQSKLSTTASVTHDPSIHDPNVGHATSVASVTASSTQAVESSAGGGISSWGQLMTAPVIGGISGGIGLVIIALLICFCNRRRKSKRNSLLAPLTIDRDQFYDTDRKGQGQYYDIYDDTVGSVSRGTNFKAHIGGAATNLGAGLAGIGSTLRFHVHPGYRPTVNLDRGNSQFYETPNPYHSRNNSSASAHALHYAAKDRADELTNKLKSVFRKPSGEETSSFAMARGISEKQANLNTAQEFGGLMDVDDRSLQMKAERHRLSISSRSSSGQKLGSLGLDFGISQDPFADPVSNTNPFADPNKWDSISRPDPAMPRTNTYISDVRRSRGESLDSTTRGHKNAPSSLYGPAAYRAPSISNVSRYPSSMAPSTESFRDTVYSTAFNINNTRRMAGRSDPFDLERPELWLPMLANSVPKVPDRNSPALPERGSDLYPDPLLMPDFKPGQAPVIPIRRDTASDTRIPSQGTYESKYSSRTSMGDWGDPGPDIGSGPSSLASQGFYGMNGNTNQPWDLRRHEDNVSLISATSSRGGVGKAR